MKSLNFQHLHIYEIILSDWRGGGLKNWFYAIVFGIAHELDLLGNPCQLHYYSRINQINETIQLDAII